MKSVRKEPELVALRKLAEQLAGARKERVTSAHLLAAIASRESPAADLLAERALNAERLLRAREESGIDDIFLFPAHDLPGGYAMPEAEVEALERVIRPRLGT